MKETYILSAPLAEDSIAAVSYYKKKPAERKEDAVNSSKPHTYEEAVSAAGFGRFNIMLLLITMPSATASICATTTVSFILSEAQCDLALTLEDKGLLNAIAYAGMISSGFLWGMIGDYYGRRTVLFYSFCFDSIFCLLGTVAQNKWLLLVSRFLSGVVMNGPVSVLMSYLSEFHSTSFRPRLITIIGVHYSIARTVLPLLAWLILPLKLHKTVIEGYLDYTSWQLYIVLCCIPSIIGAFVHYYLPETPKFLMTKGRFDEALVVFKRIYTANTGNPPSSIPFSELTDETFIENSSAENINKPKSKLRIFVNIMKSIKPLFMPPYLTKTILMCSIFFGCLLGGNTLRLWLPQLFTTMDAYMHTNGRVNSTVCSMLSYTRKLDIELRTNQKYHCTVPEVTDEVYINNTIVPLSSIVGYFLVAALVKKLGKKTLLVGQFLLAAVIGIGNYWASDTVTTVILSSLYLTFFSICATTATGIAVEIYPTNLRTMATSVFLLCGRLGSILGNVLFPFLLYAGCLPPFLLTGGSMFMCAIFGFMLPSTENKPLK